MAVPWLTNSLGVWVSFIARRSWLVLALLIGLTTYLADFSVRNFRINSDLSGLISQKASWREDFDRYEALFPDAVRTSAIVVSGTSFKGVEDAAQQVEKSLRARQQFFSSIYAPENDPFFRDNALLFLELDALDDMVDRISSAQPLLSVIAEDPSLRGVLSLISSGLTGDTPEGFSEVIEILAQSGEKFLAEEDAAIRWTDEFFESTDTIYRVILLKGQSNFNEALPGSKIVAELRKIISSVETQDGVTIRLTGEIPLQHEEIEAAVDGVQLAGWISLILLGLIIVLGVRSLKIVCAIFLMLLVGVTWTSAYAMATIGEFNTLSIIFLVMFFGLGVDFALHFSLRYQEAINKGEKEKINALVKAAQSVGGAIAICTATTSIGFLGFLPTEYKGLADLGVIASGGMVIAAILTLTLLPAVYSVIGDIKPKQINFNFGERVVSRMIVWRKTITYGIGALGIVGVYLASQIYFDYSVLALKDENSESMVTLRELQDEGITTDYSLIIVSKEHGVPFELEKLEAVDSVRGPYDYIPSDQGEKLFILDDLQQILWSVLYSSESVESLPRPEELRDEIDQLLEEINQVGLTSDPNISKLGNIISEISTLSDANLLLWQSNIISNLVEEWSWLQRAIFREPISFEDLPTELRKRLVSDQGHFVSIVTPANDVSELPVLEEFVESVREKVPVATGRSVIEWGVGQIVLKSFIEAFLYALAGIFIILFLCFRNLRDPMLIVTPLLLTSIFTMAVCAVIGLPLNMANVLVLPLIVGLGVDNGVHVVDRYHSGRDIEQFMRSSTPRAVLISTLTTIGAFIALSFSPHQGTASVGMLLSISVIFLLFFTVLFLPLLLTFLARNNAR